VGEHSDFTRKYQVPDVPEGQSGDWFIKRFEVSLSDAVWDRIRSNGVRYTPEGKYTGLYRKDPDFNSRVVVMSDTPDEIYDHAAPIQNATGNVLIVGLGLGMLLNALAMKPDITHITVIEKSPDVLTLVREHYQKKYDTRIEFIQADIFEWDPPPGVHWNYIWFDIWDTISSENLLQMSQLHKKFKKFTEQDAFWCQKLCQRQARKEIKEMKLRSMRKLVRDGRRISLDDDGVAL
jgi:hypothetical protein